MLPAPSPCSGGQLWAPRSGRPGARVAGAFRVSPVRVGVRLEFGAGCRRGRLHALLWDLLAGGCFIIDIFANFARARPLVAHGCSVPRGGAGRATGHAFPSTPAAMVCYQASPAGVEHDGGLLQLPCLGMPALYCRCRGRRLPPNGLAVGGGELDGREVALCVPRRGASLRGWRPSTCLGRTTEGLRLWRRLRDRWHRRWRTDVGGQ